MFKSYFISFLFFLVLVLSSKAYTQNTYPIDSLECKPNRKSFITYLPGITALTYGVVALSDNNLKNLDYDIKGRINEKRPSFNTHADDYLRYIPYLTMMGMEVFGVQGKNNIKDKATLMLGSAVVAYGSTYVLKNITNKKRPNNEDNKSFPSGHATIAFAGAEMVNQEYGNLSAFYSIAGYTVASATAVLRVYNNDHWFSDVVAGAGIGILSTKLAYLVYPTAKKIVSGKKKNLDLTIYPAYEKRTMFFTIVGRY